MKPQAQARPEGLYSEILLELKQRGVVCAITGGLACVQFGVAHYTADCDVICAPNNATQLLGLLRQKSYKGELCAYRSLSAPLDERWLAGGYTAHFQWLCKSSVKPFLDVFGVPPRLSSDWQDQMQGLFAGLDTVAEMKRTKRRRDWDQATALGLKMLEAGDQKGWLHIFDPNILEALLATSKPGAQQLSRRPVLRLALDQSPLLARAIQTEVDFWSRLDHIRLRVYEVALRPYARANRMDLKLKTADLMVQHQIFVTNAEKLLPHSPLRDYGFNRMVKEATEAVGVGLDPKVLEYLPDVSANFTNLIDTIE